MSWCHPDGISREKSNFWLEIFDVSVSEMYSCMVLSKVFILFLIEKCTQLGVITGQGFWLFWKLSFNEGVIEAWISRFFPGHSSIGSHASA